VGESETTSSATVRGGGAWVGDYSERVAEYWQRTARTMAVLGNRWGDRSIEQERWTVDTTTADAVEAWEELTPLVGEGIELGLEGLRQFLMIGRRDG
jgi:hypothetical protein